MWRTSCDAHVLHVVSWHFTLLHRGPARPLPLLTEWFAPIPAWRSLVMGQPCTPRTFTGNGSAPTVQMERKVSSFVDSTAAHSLARGTGCGRPLGDLEFGTYFPAGGSSPESSRRRSRPAVLLAVHCVSEKPTASYGVRPAETGAPGCRAGMRSLRSDQPRARTAYCAVGVYPGPGRAHTYDHQRYDWR